MKDNKLISEFMGLNYEHEMEFIWDKLQRQGFTNKDLLNNSKSFDYFHNSWDELMPVLDRIKSIGFDYAICNIKIDEQNLSEIMISPVIKEANIEIHTRTGEKLISATYKAVVQFINWYNLNKE